jgi:hypothetical protein
MATKTGKLIRQQQARDARFTRETRALHSDRPMTEVPFEWQSKQTALAVHFPTYGWVPAEAIRWRKSDGTIVPWSCGRQGDALLIATEFVKR